MTKTYILLFRGINVGGRNILPMKALSQLLEGLGYESVRTYIQSGNVVLRSSKKPGKNINLEIESEFGFKPKIIIQESHEFKTATENNPFSAHEGKSAHLYFSEKPLKPDIDKLNSLAAPNEKFELSTKVFYLLAPNGIGKSKLVAGLEKCLGVPATGRNLNTINKLLTIIEEG